MAETGISFEVFNARFSQPENVGSSFVLSPFLKSIVGGSHTAVLGPRGSGKTTLLKMLTLPALTKWSHPQRSEIVSSIDYLSVYTPASLTWSADFRSFSDQPLREEVEDLLSISLFRHGLLSSIVETWSNAANPSIRDDIFLSKFYLPISEEKEASLVKDLSSRWAIDPRVLTLGGLRGAIVERVRLLQRLTIKAAYVGATAKQLVDEHEFLSSLFIDDASEFCDFLKESYGFKEKLNLCFDEVEIAADPIAKQILRAPRSVDQRLLFKFSAAPYVGIAYKIHDAKAPSETNDYSIVPLSKFSSDEMRGFSEELFRSMCLRYGPSAPAQQVLGRSFLDDDDISTQYNQRAVHHERYKSGGTYQRKFSDLLKKDKGFREYIKEKSLNTDDLSQGESIDRASDIRKILWPVLIREEFLSDEGTSSQRRLRAKRAISDIYTGAGSLFAICDGNPRWINALLDSMAQVYSHTPGRPVKRSFQKEQIIKIISAYFTLLSTVPSSRTNSPKSLQTITSLVDLLDRVGNYFKASVLSTAFNPDPVLSFLVDDGVSPPLLDLVGKGINIGALISEKTKPEQSSHVGDIKGLKVRLCNILAPHFRLPLIGGRSINLTTLLQRHREGGAPLQDLFGEKI